MAPHRRGHRRADGDVGVGAREVGFLHGPGKAADAGGVAVPGLEQSQNAQRLSRSREEGDTRLEKILADIHATCVEYGYEGDHVNYVKGASIAGFVTVADAILADGVM